MMDTLDPVIIGGARVRWDPILDTFVTYQVQRSDPYTPWQTIARITDQTVDAFDDWEGRIGIESSYRMRAVTSIGLHSAWSDVVTATACGPECGYTFTTNEAPELNVGYVDHYDGPADRTYEWPEAQQVVERQFYLRNFQVVFRPLERSGVKFTRRLLTNGFTAPARPGPEAFTALRELAWEPLSYVCVRDESGNRWYSSITVPDGTVHQPGHFSFATVNVTQVTDIPSTPDANAGEGEHALLLEDAFFLVREGGGHYLLEN